MLTLIRCRYPCVHLSSKKSAGIECADGNLYKTNKIMIRQVLYAKFVIDINRYVAMGAYDLTCGSFVFFFVQMVYPSPSSTRMLLSVKYRILEFFDRTAHDFESEVVFYRPRQYGNAKYPRLNLVH